MGTFEQGSALTVRMQNGLEVRVLPGSPLNLKYLRTLHFDRQKVDVVGVVVAGVLFDG
jgi:hypothetical protein